MLTEEGGGCFGGLEEFAGRDALVVGVDGHVGKGPLERVEPGAAGRDLDGAGHGSVREGWQCGEEVN
jgi:hypothetical protein